MTQGIYAGITGFVKSIRKKGDRWEVTLSDAQNHLYLLYVDQLVVAACTPVTPSTLIGYAVPPDYVWNQTGAAQPGGFWVAGSGRVDGPLEASGAVILHALSDTAVEEVVPTTVLYTDALGRVHVGRLPAYAEPPAPPPAVVLHKASAITVQENAENEWTIGLDLSATTLVRPTISVTWEVRRADGTATGITSTEKTFGAELGARVAVSATYRYPGPGVDEGLPTAAAGTWGAELPAANTPSSAFTNGGALLSADTGLSVTLSKPRTGLIAVNGQVRTASGVDTTSDVATLQFLPAAYVGVSTKSVLTPSDIAALGGKAMQAARTRTQSGVSAAPGEYTYYAYPAAYGPLLQVTQNGAEPVLGAFSRQADLSFQNDMGVTVLMAVYRSNADNAFTNATLKFE